jgi:hypothetical protein
MLAMVWLCRVSQAQSVVPMYQVWNSTPPWESLAQVNPNLASPDFISMDDRLGSNVPCDANVLQRNLPPGYTVSLPAIVTLNIVFDRRVDLPTTPANTGPAPDFIVTTNVIDPQGHAGIVTLAFWRNSADTSLFAPIGLSITQASVNASREVGAGSQEIHGLVADSSTGEPIVAVDAVIPYPGPFVRLIKPAIYFTSVGSAGVSPGYLAQQEDRATFLPSDPGVELHWRIPAGILRLPGFNLPVDEKAVQSVFARYKVQNVHKRK